MDTTSPLMGDGLAGPDPLPWTPGIKALTAAYSAPLGFGHPAGRVRRGLARLAIVAAVTALAMALPAGTAVPIAGGSRGAASTAHVTDTWT
jgi:hypothetical protein